MSRGNAEDSIPSQTSAVGEASALEPQQQRRLNRILGATDAFDFGSTSRQPEELSTLPVIQGGHAPHLLVGSDVSTNSTCSPQQPLSPKTEASLPRTPLGSTSGKFRAKRNIFSIQESDVAAISIQDRAPASGFSLEAHKPAISQPAYLAGDKEDAFSLPLPPDGNSPEAEQAPVSNLPVGFNSAIPVNKRAATSELSSPLQNGGAEIQAVIHVMSQENLPVGSGETLLEKFAALALEEGLEREVGEGDENRWEESLASMPVVGDQHQSLNTEPSTKDGLQESPARNLEVFVVIVPVVNHPVVNMYI